MNSKIWCTAFLAGVCILASVRKANGAAIYYYANWSAYTVSTSSPGSATGTITTSNGSFTVSYSGDLSSSTQVSNAGTNYYTNYPSVYTNSTVSNLPSRSDVLTLAQAYSATPNVLTFSVPVVNPILDIVSLGNSVKVIYNFSSTPVILSQGAAAYGGCSTCLSVSGNALSGSEGDGVVQFTGTFSQLSWTVTGGENWNGFTVGVANSVAATPEPSTFSFVGLAFVLCGFGARKKWMLLKSSV